MFSLAPKAVVLATIRPNRCWRSLSSAAPKNARRSVIASAGKQLLDDAGDSRRVFGERAHHPILGVAERRLCLDGYRCMVALPTGQPRRLVHARGPAQQRNVGQTRCAGTGLDDGRAQRDRFRHQVRGELLTLLCQQLERGRHLLAVALLGPHAHHRGDRWVQRRERHQRLAHGVVADVDRQSGHTQLQQRIGDRPRCRAHQSSSESARMSTAITFSIGRTYRCGPAG